MPRSRLHPDPFTEPRWRRRKDARPSEILDAALGIFVEKGFAAARIEDIAQRAGVTKGTVYLYFPSKQAVFEALIRQAILPRFEAIEAIAAAYDGPVIPLFQRLIQEIGQRVAGELAVFPKLIIAEAGNFPEIARFYRFEVIARGEALFSRLYARGVATGELPDIDPRIITKLTVAPLLLSAIWKTTFSAFDEEAFDVAALIQTHAQVLARGLAALAREEKT